MTPAFSRRTNVTIRLTPCRSRDKGDFLWRRLDAGGRDGALAARVKNPDAARRMLDMLKRAGRSARMLASNQTEAEQAQCRAWFAGAERPALVVAGDVAIPERTDIRQLYVMNLAPSLLAVLADLDAVGRDLLAANAEFFASMGDRDFRLDWIAAASRGEDDPAEAVMAAKRELARVTAWIENDGCARQYFVRELFENSIGPCGNCGWCLGKRGSYLPPEI